MRESITISILLLALTGIGLTNWHMARAPIDVTPIKSRNPASLPDISDGVIALHVREAKLFQVSERPLFSVDRKPWSPPQAATAPPPPSSLEIQQAVEVVASAPAAPPPVVTLIGIQKTPKGSMVLLSDQSGAAPVWLRDGEDYRDWQVRNITEVSADLESGKAKITLELYPAQQFGPATP